MTQRLLLSALASFLLLLLTHRSSSEPTQDKQALTSFLNRVPHSTRIQWNVSDSVCNWVGVTCDRTRSHVHNLRLPAAGLVGPIPPNTIGRLSELRVLSIHSNRLTGSLPSDFANLTFLRAFYVGNNELSGEFPVSLTRLTRLTRLDLSSNNFSGSIPFGVNNLTALTALLLQNNNFSGTLPSINSNLAEFSVANNSLNGSIPSSLAKFPESSFAGNLQLCGGPLQPCNSSFFPPPSPSPVAIVPSSPAKEGGGKKKLSKGTIIAISMAAALFLLILLLCFVFCLLRRRGSSTKTSAKGATATAAAAGVGPVGGGGAGEAGTSSSKDDLTSGTGPDGGQRNRLAFVNGGNYTFDLEDLLRASAEVLGKGSVGTSYKAVLEEGTTVVVKRLKEVVAGKTEFESLMEVLGKCKHENVVALRAYYYSKDEKLLVFDYFSNGSLSALLHGIILILFATFHLYSHITMSLFNFKLNFLFIMHNSYQDDEIFSNFGLWLIIVH